MIKKRKNMVELTVSESKLGIRFFSKDQKEVKKALKDLENIINTIYNNGYIGGFKNSDDVIKINNVNGIIIDISLDIEKEVLE